MSNVETNLIKPFPVAFSGHTLKYEIECICKIFLPMRKFTFLYDTTRLPADAEEGASRAALGYRYSIGGR